MPNGFLADKINRFANGLATYEESLNLGAVAGQEKIWQKAFAHFNVSVMELQDWFAGPGFLAWQRMGNLQGWGGPLPQSYIDAQAGKVSQAHLHTLRFCSPSTCKLLVLWCSF